MNDIEKLNRIISGGYCIGCGACAAMYPDHITMAFDQYGMYQPQIRGGMSAAKAGAVLKVCPFSDEGPNEDELAVKLFPEAKPDQQLGRYSALYAGYAAESEFRAKGSSGGMVSWILAELLATDKVDGVIHMRSSAGHTGDPLFSYAVSSTEAAILDGAKSKYYPMEMSGVLEFIRASDKRYALVGVPCFIKAARRLMLEDPVIADRVKFCVGLVCGHLKSKAFADCFAWQADIQPGQLEEIDFRVKLPERPSSDYGVMVAGNGKQVTRPTRDYFGSNWGVGFFKYSACEYCDDVFAETADIAVGDAWLPEFTTDNRGNSIVLVRSAELGELIREGMKSGRLFLNDCSADAMAESQAGGLRHRRDGLSYRLFLKQETGEWAPKKRVSASAAGIGSDRRKIYFLREILRQRSHELWLESVNAGNFAIFESGMKKLVSRYERAYTSFPVWVIRQVKKAIKRCLGL